MPFRYVGQNQQPGLQGLNYGQPQQEAESPFSRIAPQNIKSAYDMYQLQGAGMNAPGAGPQQPGFMDSITGMFGGGGETAAAGGSSAGGSGSGLGSAAASAGPWAALAAIIGVNEYNAKKGGYRSENKGEYAFDMVSGAVANQDMQNRWLPKLGLEEGSSANKYASMGLDPVGYAMDKLF